MSTENNGLPTSEETEEFFRKGNDYDRLQSELERVTAARDQLLSRLPKHADGDVIED